MHAIQNRLEMNQTNLIETSRDDIITRYAIPAMAALTRFHFHRR